MYTDNDAPFWKLLGLFFLDFDFADLFSRFVGWWQGVCTSSLLWVRSIN
jgi:hypothetical protein